MSSLSQDEIDSVKGYFNEHVEEDSAGDALFVNDVDEFIDFTNSFSVDAKSQFVKALFEV